MGSGSWPPCSESVVHAGVFVTSLRDPEIVILLEMVLVGINIERAGIARKIAVNRVECVGFAPALEMIYLALKSTRVISPVTI